MPQFHAIYRISNNSYTKARLPHATKEHCLLNFLQHFPIEETTVLADQVNVDLRKFLTDQTDLGGLKVEHVKAGSSAQSFRLAYELALTFPDDCIIYLVEDDYLHLDYSKRALIEGISRADYVSLCDYPDKYIPASRGGNPLIPDSGGEPTQVILTHNNHWKATNSTTCTFATTVKVLKEDYEIWKKHGFATLEQTHPNDFPGFLELVFQKKRTLITPIPTLATHTHLETLSPLVDWTKI